MEHTEWDSVFQFVSEPLDMPDAMPEKPVSEKASLAAPPSQMPTPPLSSQDSPTESERELDTIVSVSTTFHPGANLNPLPADLVFISSDAVFFYVHSHQVLGASENGFRALLPAKVSPKSVIKGANSNLDLDFGSIIPLPEPAPVLNIVLHTIYEISFAHYSPALDTLIAAVEALSSYGVPVAQHCAPGSPLYTLLLAQAPIAPLEVYALAAQHDLYELAVPTSAHLLGYHLATLNDEHARKMGAVYLRRLFFLHLGRVDALKRLLLPPPYPHAPTPECDFVEQKKLTRAWALASAYLAWDARPDLSMSAIESALCPLGEHLSCEVCRTALNERIKQLVVQWSVVRRTI
ncbi:hypothetical protein WOLCODRAFT_17151 [Wolfiporia cocos MD-104 SS10]|uniref:BTB domain-containing protein n=1 Tax=Wolfiporia cocos (strain MD-104) TaxID=742152 RepID=A0A2H3JH51_WOLCO|nr:hypothetical protein WOLCODRAFT_17151 [Wolfiporia cocos MD-104 SS10]